jgi:hypothetical protein
MPLKCNAKKEEVVSVYPVLAVPASAICGG